MKTAKNTKIWTKPELTRLGKLGDVAGPQGLSTQAGAQQHS